MSFFITKAARELIPNPVVAIFRDVDPSASTAVYDASVADVERRISEIKSSALATAEFQGYRSLYAKLGYPGIETAGERLLRIVAEKGFGRFGPLVDSYNLIAVENGEGLGCHDVSDLPVDFPLLFKRASGDEKIFTSPTKEKKIKMGDLTYGFTHEGTFKPLAWLGKEDRDSAKYQLRPSTNAVLFTAIGNEATSEEYNIGVCQRVFQNIKYSSPQARMEIRTAQTIEEID
ncbi:MAG: hypothetical protein JSS09_02135 [Verrucomicrobia bacterium]|nr:hypothetical protein [Verrucomicrobiota bacterium]